MVIHLAKAMALGSGHKDPWHLNLDEVTSWGTGVESVQGECAAYKGFLQGFDVCCRFCVGWVTRGSLKGSKWQRH